MNGEHLLSQTAIVTDRTPLVVDGELSRDEFGVVQTVETTRTVRCWTAQTASGEFPPIAEATSDGFFPPCDPISSTSKVTVNGLTFEVVGPPAQLINPRNGEPALVLAVLRRTTG